MGWTECGDMPVESKADLKRYADALYSEDIHEWDGCICTDKVLVRRRVLKSSIAKGTWYGAIENTTLETGKTDVWAGVCLVGKSEDGCFLYKDISESSLPCYYDCPKSVLDLLSPTDNEYALAWRQKCRSALSEKAERKRFTSRLRDFAKTGKPVTWTAFACNVYDAGDKVRLWPMTSPKGRIEWCDPFSRVHVPTKHLTAENVAFHA